MANAKKDNNGINTILAVAASTGSYTLNVKVNSVTHAMKIMDGTTGSNKGPTNALKDDNSVPCLMAVSSVDGATPVPLYADSNGNLLIQST